MNIYKLEYEFNREKLLAEAKLSKDWNFWTNTEKLDSYFQDYWSIKHIDKTHTDYYPYAIEIAQYFELRTQYICKPRFYHLKKGYEISFHKDIGTLSSINFMLTDILSPMIFRNESVIYNSALINVQTEHMMQAKKEDRYVYKLSFKNNTFEEVKSKLEKEKLIL